MKKDTAQMLTIILPATDETESLTETVHQIHSLFQGAHLLHFLIVTSPTLTTSACRETVQTLLYAFKHDPAVTIEELSQTTPGIGGALRDAFHHLRGEYTVLMASDLETDPKTLPSLISRVENGADIATASRWKKGVQFDGYHPGKLVLNFFFQQLLRILYFTRLSDITYAYRVYKTPILTKFHWEETRHPFFLECILKPLRAGYTIAEVSTTWKMRTEGISHGNALDTLSYIRTAFRIRLRSKRLLY